MPSEREIGKVVGEQNEHKPLLNKLLNLKKRKKSIDKRKNVEYNVIETI